MVEAARQPRRDIRESSYLFVFLFATWLALTSSLHWQELLTGILVSVALTAFLRKTYEKLGLPPFSFKRAWYFAVYLLVLLKEIVRANLDVAYRVIHPRLPIKPGIVAVHTELRQDIAKMILANSITLTPGTFTLDILGDTLLVHWIDVRSEDTEEAARLISGRFEKYLREIFG
jgi:multicomponent Na+:H+ antiporter subunit E